VDMPQVVQPGCGSPAACAASVDGHRPRSPGWSCRPRRANSLSLLLEVR
jgi:hypothetical protein